MRIFLMEVKDERCVFIRAPRPESDILGGKSENIWDK